MRKIKLPNAHVFLRFINQSITSTLNFSVHYHLTKVWFGDTENFLWYLKTDVDLTFEERRGLSDVFIRVSPSHIFTYELRICILIAGTGIYGRFFRNSAHALVQKDACFQNLTKNY